MALKKTAAQMVSEARARIEEIDSAEAIAMLDDENVQFVDLRDPRERERTGPNARTRVRAGSALRAGAARPARPRWRS